MILIAGVLLLVWVITVPVTALHLAGMRWTPGKSLLPFLICLVPLVIFFLRPDEEMEAGEDPGSYLHSAISFADAQRLRFPDSGLALLPAAERPLFRYGHAGFLATKDAVLWSKDRQAVDVGPHFLPAYSVLLSMPVALGFPYLAFWVSPLLAVLGAVMLGILARSISRSTWAGWIAGVLYLLNPVVAWNARALRAEWPAALLVLGGMALLLEIHDEDDKRPCKAWVGWLAGFSLAGAMLFHITALYILLPVVVVMLWDRMRQPLPFWIGVAMGVSLLAMQLVHVSDPYWMLAQFESWQRRVALMAAVGAMIGSSLAFGWLWRWWQVRRPKSLAWIVPMAGATLSASFVFVVLYAVRYRATDGAIPFLPGATASYISLTDFNGVARLFSHSWLVVAMAGLPCLTLFGPDRGFKGRRLLCMLGPGALVVGWMNNYMFETRRLLLAWLPLSILATVLFCWWAGRVSGWVMDRALMGRRSLMVERFVMFAVAGLCLVAGMRGRMPLYRTWNHRGMYRFYRNIGAAARAEGDVLLASYTQTAVPVERLSGLPLLPFSWGYRSETEIRGVESVFQRLVLENPDTRHLFLTPFQGAALPGLALEKIADWQLRTARLARARHAVPDRTEEFQRMLSLYRVHARLPAALQYPYARLLDGDRLGIRGDANFMPNRTVELEGMKVAKGELGLAGIVAQHAGPANRLLLFLAHPNEDGRTGVWRLKEPNGMVAMEAHSIADKWSILLLSGRDLMDARLMLDEQIDVYLTDAYLLGAGAPPLRLDAHDKEMFRMRGMHSQWLRANGSIALPLDHDQRFLYVHATSGRSAIGDVNVTFAPEERAAAAVSTTVANGWQWLVVPLTATGDGRFMWYDVKVDRPWNPGIRGFPDDLGLRISAVVVQ